MFVNMMGGGKSMITDKNTSEIFLSSLFAAWYTKILGKYNRPAIHEITEIKCKDLKRR